MAFEDVSGDTTGQHLSERLLLSLQKFGLENKKLVLRWCRYCFMHKSTWLLSINSITRLKV